MKASHFAKKNFLRRSITTTTSTMTSIEDDISQDLHISTRQLGNRSLQKTSPDRSQNLKIRVMLCTKGRLKSIRGPQALRRNIRGLLSPHRCTRSPPGLHRRTREPLSPRTSITGHPALRRSITGTQGLHTDTKDRPKITQDRGHHIMTMRVTR